MSQSNPAVKQSSDSSLRQSHVWATGCMGGVRRTQKQNLSPKKDLLGRQLWLSVPLVVGRYPEAVAGLVNHRTFYLPVGEEAALRGDPNTRLRTSSRAEKVGFNGWRLRQFGAGRLGGVYR